MLAPSIAQNIRIFEWFSLILHIIIFLSLHDNELPLLHILIYGGFFILSFYIPENCFYLQRRLYIYGALLLAIFANSMSVATNFIVYIYLGKSCFILQKIEVFLITILTGIGWVFSELHLSFSADYSSNDIIFNPLYGPINAAFSEILISASAIYSGSSILILLFCFTILAEQASRRKAEALSRQIEELTKTLERTRIARDIHDSLGHTLTNLDIQLKLAQRLFSSNSDEALRSINLAQTLSIQCIEDISLALASIRKSDFDLNQAIDHLITQIQSNTHMKATVEMSLPPLSSHMSYQIYFILKECMINIQKHAQASQVSLKGQLISSGVHLEVEDNGIGFVAQKSSIGFGLKGISERVQMLGGKLEINSILGQGTFVAIYIPL